MKALLKVIFAAMILSLTSSLALALSDDQAQLKFTNAVKAYHDAQYVEAVKLNESILMQGLFSPELYYNLGNAHFKLRHLGAAIVNYLRAHRLEPRDSDVKSNLSFARSMVDNYLPWPSNPLFTPVQQVFSNRELLWVGFWSVALTGAFLLGGLYGGMRRKRLVLGVVLGIILSAYMAGAGIVRTLHQSGMSVCVQKVDARFEPNLQATVYFKIPEGTEVKVLRIKEEWAKVQRSDNKIGWVPLSSVERM